MYQIYQRTVRNLYELRKCFAHEAHLEESIGDEFHPTKKLLEKLY